MICLHWNQLGKMVCKVRYPCMLSAVRFQHLTRQQCSIYFKAYVFFLKSQGQNIFLVGGIASVSSIPSWESKHDGYFKTTMLSAINASITIHSIPSYSYWFHLKPISVIDHTHDMGRNGLPVESCTNLFSVRSLWDLSENKLWFKQASGASPTKWMGSSIL